MRLFKQQEGTVLVLFAILLLPLLGFIGLTIDAGRAYSVKLQLRNALDAAALTGARFITATDRDNRIRAMFEQNWKQGYMGSDVPDITISVASGNRLVEVKAEVTMPTTFMQLFGVNNVDVGSLAEAQPGGKVLEVALALDTTSSMDIATVTGERRVDAMKRTAKDFVDTLFDNSGGSGEEETIVSLVPFTNMVNVGPQMDHILAPNSLDNIIWDWPRNSTQHNKWRGCVFERSFYNDANYKGLDMTDDPPADVDSYYWPYHVVQGGGEMLLRCNGVPVLPAYGPPVCYGDAPVVPCPPPPTCWQDGTQVPCSNPAPTVCYGARPVVPCTGPYVPVTPATPIWTDPNPGTPGGGFLAGLPSCPQSPDPSRPATQPYGLTNVGAPGTYWSGYTLYEPYAVYQAISGQKHYHAKPRAVASNPAYGVVAGYGWNKAIPNLRNVSPVASQNVDTRNSICCFGGNTDMQDLRWWTQNGRWIKPWPSKPQPKQVKFGGWGNSGCGLPLIPETENKKDIIDAIDNIEVVRKNVESGRDIFQYEGTIIQQGLAWGWRTVSPNWRGYWKYDNGTAIRSDLPYDYDRPETVKAVVVMTDGLNFMPDPAARRTGTYGYSSWFNKAGSTINITKDSNLSYYGGDQWNGDFHDSSAYGLLNRQMTAQAAGTGTSDGAYSFCRLRQQARVNNPSEVNEEILDVWKCREYSCMLRDASGTNCMKSTAGTIWNTATDDPNQALYGPYFDELERRLTRTCANMTNEGVRPFFILFDVAAHPLKDRTLAKLRSCVGSLGGVYDAANPDELKSAFDGIANTLKKLRLTK